MKKSLLVGYAPWLPLRGMVGSRGVELLALKNMESGFYYRVHIIGSVCLREKVKKE